MHAGKINEEVATKFVLSLFFGLAASAFFHSRAFCFRVNRLRN